MHYGSKYFSNNKQPTITVSNEEQYELEDKPQIGLRTGLTKSDAVQVDKQYGCYIPNSSPGMLQVKVLQAGPFADPGHYYVCVTARDSTKNTIMQCNDDDLISTSDPEWDTAFVFEPTVPDSQFYSFDIVVKKQKYKAKNPTILQAQTIWVESKQHSGKYYTNKEQSVLYKYDMCLSSFYSSL